MNKYKEFSLNDTVIICRKPSVWSSALSHNNPLSKYGPSYPFTGEIYKMEYMGVNAGYTACVIGGYGFDLTYLIEKEIIEKVVEEAEDDSPIPNNLSETKLAKFMTEEYD